MTLTLAARSGDPSATATPLLQREIVEQLGLRDAHLFIHGFRRSNVAIELVELRTSARAATVERELAQAEPRAGDHHRLPS